MQIVVFLLIIMGLYALVDTGQIDQATLLAQEADTVAKQMEYYQAQAVNLCETTVCPNGKIALTQLSGSTWIYNPGAAFSDYMSATDGTYVATTWHLRAGWSNIDPNHLYGGTLASLLADTQNSSAVGAYNSTTGTVGNGTVVVGPDSNGNGSGIGTVAAVTLSATMQTALGPVNGAPMLITKIH